VGSPEAASVVEHIRSIAAIEPDALIQGSWINRAQAQALLAVVDAAEEALPWVGIAEDGRGHWPPADVQDNLRESLAALHTPDSAGEQGEGLG